MSGPRSTATATARRGPPSRRKVAEGRQVILEIDPQGAFQVKSLVPDSVLIFIMPPSWDELQRRLEGRGSETEAQVETRLETAKRELELVGSTIMW